MAEAGSSWWKWLIILLLCAGIVAGGIWYWKRPSTEDIQYRYAEVTQGDVTQVVTATGQMNPVVNVQVGSQISGIIQKLFVDFNSKVTNGQLVAQLDPATYRANVIQAEGELANAQATLELAQINARRAEELSQNTLIARAEYDNAVAELHKAEAQVKIRQGALDKVRVDLERTTIYAPIDGMVISRNVDVGQTVAASFSAPTLFVIANDLTKMQINAMVSEADIGGVEVGQPVTFTVDAFPQRTFEGEVTQIRNAPITNQNVVTYDTVIDVNNADLKLKPGMTANVSVIVAHKENVLKVPNAALRFRPPETVLAKMNPDAAGAKGPQFNNPTNGQRLSAGPRDRGPDVMGAAAGPRPDRLERTGTAGGASGGPPGRRPGMRGRRPDGLSTRTVYSVTDTNAVVQGNELPKAVSVKTGISDSLFTEVIEGLSPDQIVITGLNQPQQQSTGPMGPPNPFGGGMRRGFR